MVNYICNICNKEFSKKSNFLYHTQIKKKPCKNKKIINANLTPINADLTPINTDLTSINTTKNTEIYKELFEKQYILDKRDNISLI